MSMRYRPFVTDSSIFFWIRLERYSLSSSCFRMCLREMVLEPSSCA